MNIEFGIPQWCFPGKGLYCMNMSAQLGLKAIHVDLGNYADGYPLTQDIIQNGLLEDAEENNIRILAMALNDLCTHGFVKSGKHFEIAYETMKNGVAAASKMKIPAITIPSFFDNEIKNEEDFERTIEAYKFCCDIAGKAGIDVYTENVLLPEKLYEFFERVNAENLKLLFDSQNYHVVKGYDSAAILEQIYDNVDLGNILHLKDGVGEMSNRYLGQGDCNVYKSVEILKAKKYTGTIFVENNYSLLSIDEEYENCRIMAVQKDIDILNNMFM